MKIPEEDEKLASELVLPKYSHSSNGLIRVESKEAMKRRSGASPDAADAFCLTFAGNAAYGQGKWGRRAEGALQRSIGGIVYQIDGPAVVSFSGGRSLALCSGNPGPWYLRTSK